MKNESMHTSLMVGTIIGVSLGLFQFWPFTLVFLILGGIATGVISAMTGYAVDFFLVLFVEYLLMVSIMFLALYVQERRFDRR